MFKIGLIVNGIFAKISNYICGGSYPTSLNIITRFITSSQVVANLSAVLSVTRTSAQEAIAALVGYVVCGLSSGPINRVTIDKLNYSTETCGAISTTSDQVILDGQGIYNLLKSYHYMTPGTNLRSLIFSSETWAGTGKTIGNSNYRTLRALISSLRGYYLAGEYYDGDYWGGNSEFVTSLRFSDEALVPVAASLLYLFENVGTLNGLLKGYIAGTYQIATIESFRFSDNTRISVAATLAADRTAAAYGVDADKNNGYLFCGYGFPSTTYRTSVEQLTFATETRTTLFASLTARMKCIAI